MIDPNFFAADKNQFHVTYDQQRNHFLEQPSVSDFAQQLFGFGFDVVPFEVGLNPEDFPFFGHRNRPGCEDKIAGAEPRRRVALAGATSGAAGSGDGA